MTEHKSALIAIIVAIIGCIGLVGAAIVGILPTLLGSANESNVPVTVVVTQIVVVTQTPFQPSLTITPENVTQAPLPNLDTSCPPTMGYGYSLEKGYFKPGMAIVGPASLHPFEGSYQLGKALGFEDTPRWGINIPGNKEVVIPNSIDIFGKAYSPEGFYETYASDDDVLKVQNRWLTYCD